jgi:HEAT repeat protein
VTARRARSLPLGVSMLAVSVVAAVVIYFTHPGDPHDEGLLVGTAAFLWPFLLWPIAWLVCCGLVVVDYRRGHRRPASLGLLFATIAWPTVFSGYILNQKPWLPPSEKLRDSWPDVRSRGAFALGEEQRPESVALLTLALGDPDSQVRSAAATALGRFGARAEAAIPVLANALHDEDWYVGCQAAEALGAMRGLQDRVLPVLLAQISTPGTNGPWCAVKGVSRLGPDGAAAVGALTVLLRHDDPNVRSAAAEALGIIGPAAHSALPQLENALHDDNQWVRKAALVAVPRVRPTP